MNCPHCNTAETTRVARTISSTTMIVRTRRCESCAVEWLTQEVPVGAAQSVPHMRPPVTAPVHRQPPAATPGRVPSDLTLDLFSGSGDPRSGLEASERDRQDHGPGTALAVTKSDAPAVAKKPNLAYELRTKFRAAFEAEHGAEYHETAADRSQLGRYLSPGEGHPRPTPRDIAALPAVFGLYVSDRSDSFLEKRGWSLAHLLTSGALNKYRAQLSGGPRSGLSKRDQELTAGSRTFIERKQQQGGKP